MGTQWCRNYDTTLAVTCGRTILDKSTKQISSKLCGWMLDECNEELITFTRVPSISFQFFSLFPPSPKACNEVANLSVGGTIKTNACLSTFASPVTVRMREKRRSIIFPPPVKGQPRIFIYSAFWWFTVHLMWKLYSVPPVLHFNMYMRRQDTVE